MIKLAKWNRSKGARGQQSGEGFLGQQHWTRRKWGAAAQLGTSKCAALPVSIGDFCNNEPASGAGPIVRK